MKYVHQLSISKDYILQNKVFDIYALHKIVYSHFEQTRSEQELKQSVSSGIQWKEIVDTPHSKRILIFSDRPAIPNEGIELVSKTIPANLLNHSTYSFDVVVNPTYKNKGEKNYTACTNHEAVTDWFMRRAALWGIEINTITIEKITTHKIKKNSPMKHVQAHVRGTLKVIDQDKFKLAFNKGIGRSRSYGCGLLQILPIS